MVFRPIPVNTPFFSNVEDESRKQACEERRDVITDLSGATIRRPCLSSFALASAIVDGFFYWEETDLVYFVAGGNFYSLSVSGTITLIGSGLFQLGGNVTWARSNDLTLVTPGAVKKLFAVNGGRIVEYDGTTAGMLADTDAPVQSTHIISFDTYLLSNDLHDQKYAESILFSEVANPESWRGEFTSAENKPDDVVAVHTGWDEIAVFGTEVLENFYNDGVTPFLPIPGGTVQVGTRSPWSIKLTDNAYFMLDSKRQIVRVDGRQPTVLSRAIDDILTGDVDFSGVEGDIFQLKGLPLYLVTINNRTLVFDYGRNEWVGEWGSWNKTTASYDQFRARNFLNIPEWGKVICSDKTTGNIYTIDFDTYRDIGQEVRSSVVTGSFDHGSSREKRVNELRLRLKRGKVERTTIDQIEPKLLVRWRNDGQKEWSNYRTIDLGFFGEDTIYYSIYMLGVHRSRQYEFTCTDDTPFSLVDVEEDITVLTR